MAILITYNDGNRAPDVQEMILMLTPTETPILSGAQKVKASGTLHEWLEDTCTVADSTNAGIEAGEHGTPGSSVPSRITNVVQMFKKLYAVSSTEEWVRQYGNAGKYEYQQRKAMMEIGTDIELALLRGSRASGSGTSTTAARRLAGIYNFVTTNATTVVSGTKLTESFFNNMLELMVDTGGASADRQLECYVPARLKRVISAYSQGTGRYQILDDKRLRNTLDTYESDFGLVKIFYHRYALATTLGNATCLIVDMSKIAVAVGEELHILPIAEVAQTGDYKKGAIRGELTIEVRGESQFNKATGLDTSFN
jgi:hypothetical protein